MGVAVPESSMTATLDPVSTVSPSSARIGVKTPAAGEGISESTLSVDTSKSGSSRATTSPTFLNHWVMIPSVTDSPSDGSVTSVISLTLPARIFCISTVERDSNRNLALRDDYALGEHYLLGPESDRD